VRTLAVWAFCLALAFPVTGVLALGGAGHSTPAAPAAGLVSFSTGGYSSYDGSASAVADNENAVSITVHEVTVRYTNARTAAVLAEVTEPANATIPGGQAEEISFPAPASLTGAGIEDRQILVTVTGWS